MTSNGHVRTFHVIGDFHPNSLVKRVIRQIPRSLPYYGNTDDPHATDETDPIVCELMKIRPHKPSFTILLQLNEESVTTYSSKLSELLYLLLEEKQLDDNIRIELEKSLTQLISFIPWVKPDFPEKLEIDHNLAYKNRQSIPRSESIPGEINPTYPNGYLSKILIDNFDALIKFSTSYFNLTLSTQVTKYVVELIYQLYYWEVVHLAHVNPKIIDFLELIGFEVTQTTFGPIIKPPVNYLNDNLLQGLQYPFPYPFYNYSYHSFDSRVDQQKFDRIKINPYLDITLKNVDGASRKKRKGSRMSGKKSISEEPNKFGKQFSEGASDGGARGDNPVILEKGLDHQALNVTRAMSDIGNSFDEENDSFRRKKTVKHNPEEQTRSKEKMSSLRDDDAAGDDKQSTARLNHIPTDPASKPVTSHSITTPNIPSAPTSATHQDLIFRSQHSPPFRNPGFSPVSYSHYPFQSLPPLTNQHSQQPQKQPCSNSPQLSFPPRTQSTPVLPKTGSQKSPALGQQDHPRELPHISPISNYLSSQSNVLPSISKLTDQQEHALSDRRAKSGPVVSSSYKGTGLGITAPPASVQPSSQYQSQPDASNQNKLHSVTDTSYKKASDDIQYTKNSPKELPFQTIQVGEGSHLGDLRVDLGDPNFLLTEKNKRVPRHGVIHQCHLTDPNTNASCLKIFYGKNELLRHQEFVHATKKRIYKCLYCDRSGARVQSYPRHDSLARHIRRKHGITGKENKMAVNYAKENVIIVDDAEAANIEYAPEEPFTKPQVNEPPVPSDSRSPDLHDDDSQAYEKFKEEVLREKKERRRSSFGGQSIALHPASQIPISLPPQTVLSQASPTYNQQPLSMPPPPPRTQSQSLGQQQKLPEPSSSTYHRDSASIAPLSKKRSENFGDLPHLQNFSSKDANNRSFSIYMGPNSISSNSNKSSVSKAQNSPSLPAPSNRSLPQAEPSQQNQYSIQSLPQISSDPPRTNVKLPSIHDIDNEIGHIYRG